MSIKKTNVFHLYSNLLWSLLVIQTQGPGRHHPQQASRYPMVRQPQRSRPNRPSRPMNIRTLSQIRGRTEQTERERETEHQL